MNSTFCKRHKRSVGTLYVIGNFCNHSSLNCCRDFFSSIHVAENIHVHMNNGKIKSHLNLQNIYKVMKIYTVRYACNIKVISSKLVDLSKLYLRFIEHAPKFDMCIKLYTSYMEPRNMKLDLLQVKHS